MEKRPPLTSPDGSRSRNTPERCPRPLYSRESTQEHQEIPQEDQSENPIAVKVEVKEEMEELYVWGNGACKKEQINPEISTDPGDARDIPKDIKVKEEEAEHVKIREEKIPVEIGIDGRYMKYDTEEPSAVPPGGIKDEDGASDPSENEDEDTTNSSQKNQKASNFHAAPCSELIKIDPPRCGKNFANCLTRGFPDGPKEEKSYPCSQCGKNYSSKQSLLIHQKTHTGQKPYSCSQCGRRFAERSNLTRHLRTHSGEKPYSCLECGKRFYHKSSLITHEKIHMVEKPYSCLKCGESFSSQHYKLIHMTSHVGEKPYSCSECGKCFTTKSSLARHHVTHTGEKPYTCSECGKCFADKTHFIFHQKSHTGEKPFSCPECGKSFAFKPSLIKHQKNRTCVVQFSCSECGRDFRRRSSLVVHKQMHKRIHLMSQYNHIVDKPELKLHIKSQPS